jgi:hypothetical protein
MQVPTIVDTHLRVDGNLIGLDLAETIFDELTLLNPEWVEAKKRNAWGLADIDKHILLGDLDGDTVVMPRGYAKEYKLLLREHGHGVRASVWPSSPTGPTSLQPWRRSSSISRASTKRRPARARRLSAVR